MPKALTLALIFVAGTTSITVAAVAADQTTAQAPVKKAKPKKICKKSSDVTGSRIAKRVCKTEEEWATAEDVREVSAKSKGSAVAN